MWRALWIALVLAGCSTTRLDPVNRPMPTCTTNCAERMEFAKSWLAARGFNKIWGNSTPTMVYGSGGEMRYTMQRKPLNEGASELVIRVSCFEGFTSCTSTKYLVLADLLDAMQAHPTPPVQTQSAPPLTSGQP